MSSFAFTVQVAFMDAHRVASMAPLLMPLLMPSSLYEKALMLMLAQMTPWMH